MQSVARFLCDSRDLILLITELEPIFRRFGYKAPYRAFSSIGVLSIADNYSRLRLSSRYALADSTGRHLDARRRYYPSCKKHRRAMLLGLAVICEDCDMLIIGKPHLSVNAVYTNQGGNAMRTYMHVDDTQQTASAALQNVKAENIVKR